MAFFNISLYSSYKYTLTAVNLIPTLIWGWKCQHVLKVLEGARLALPNLVIHPVSILFVNTSSKCGPGEPKEVLTAKCENNFEGFLLYPQKLVCNYVSEFRLISVTYLFQIICTYAVLNTFMWMNVWLHSRLWRKWSFIKFVVRKDILFAFVSIPQLSYYTFLYVLFRGHEHILSIANIQFGLIRSLVCCYRLKFKAYVQLRRDQFSLFVLCLWVSILELDISICVAYITWNINCCVAFSIFTSTIIYYRLKERVRTSASASEHFCDSVYSIDRK